MGNAFSLTVQGRAELYKIWIDFSQTAATGSIEARCSFTPFMRRAVFANIFEASVIKLERAGLSRKSTWRWAPPEFCMRVGSRQNDLATDTGPRPSRLHARIARGILRERRKPGTDPG